MKTNTQNATITFIIKPSLIALTNCKWLGIYIKKSKKIIKNNYLFDARGTVWPFNYMKALNQDIGHLDVSINNYNKKSYYNINNILMSYMYLDIKQVNKYVSHLSHNEIITS